MLTSRVPCVFLAAALSSACTPTDPPTVKVIDRDNDGYAEGPDDCNDGDPNIHIEAVEVCDGVDNNCDGLVDDADGALDQSSATPFYADADRDGHGDPDAEVLACTAPSGHVDAAYADDCDDTEPAVNPEATEACDGLDNDCDGDIDDGDTDVDADTRWYRDDDQDTFGDDTDFIDACEAPAGFVAIAGDCDDGDDDRHPDATETCDDIDNDCDGLIDDDDSSLDASSRTDFYADSDGDGYGDAASVRPACEPSAGVVDNTLDCDDTDAAISPDAAEVCDDVDNDCDGDIDDADSSVDTSTGTTFYADRDGDGEGDAFTTTMACAQPSAYTSNDLDCDDTDASRNSTTPWYPDSDGDSYGDASASATLQCLAPGTGYVLVATDCDDSDATTSPAALEVCDEVDNDCDGTVDDGVTTTYFADADSDGYGDAASTSDACDVPSGYTTDDQDCDDTDATLNPDTVWYLDADSDGYGGSASATQCSAPSTAYTRTDGDCDDTDATSYPGGTETCDGADNNCDGTVDEGVTTTYYLDGDLDGYGIPGSTTEDCAVPVGYAAASTDCDDADSAVNPGATEICNAVDDDCNGDIDDADSGLDTSTATTWYADSDGDGDGDASSTALTCDAPSAYVSNSDDCDDTDAALYSGTVWYLDADADGYGDDTSTVTQCSAPTSVYVLAGGDCDTTDSTVNPGAAEVCDGIDQDCDGTADNGVTTDYYVDADGDGYGDLTASATAACSAPSGSVTDNTDCDDTSAVVYPSATELCDGVQNDCDATTWTDDAGIVSWYDSATAVWSDQSASWAAGTSSAPAAVTTTDAGTMNVCAGTWYVALEAQNDLELVGVGGESAVVLDGGAVATPLSVLTDGILVTVDAVTIQNGEATHTNGGWTTYWGSTELIGGNVYCEGNGALALTDVSLLGGNAYIGGSMFAVECDVALDGVTADGATATYNAGVSLFELSGTVVDSTFSNHVAPQDGGGLYLGGPGGSYVVTDSTFSDNTAQNASGIRVLDTASVTLSGNTFTDNAVTGQGAAIYIGNYVSDPVVDIDTSSFEGNTAADMGGAIYFADGELTIDASSFDTNEGTSDGGAIVAMSGTDSIITDSTFTSNTGGYGGAIGAYGDTMSIDGSTFSSNHATTVAGAINVQGGHLDLTDSDITDNTSDYSNGGVRFNQAGTTGTIDGVLFEGNEGLNSTNNGGGAALVLRYGVTVDITDTDFIDNVSTLTSGVMYGGGAIWAWSSGTQNTLSIYSSTFSGNESDSRGGAAYFRTTDVTMGNVTMDSNISADLGGAFYIYQSTLTMTSTDITNNVAALGGGIYVVGGGYTTVSATSCDLYGNSPDDSYVSVAADSDTWGVNQSFTCGSGGCN